MRSVPASRDDDTSILMPFLTVGTNVLICPDGSSLNGQVLHLDYSDMDLAEIIDHTMLKPEATRADIQKLCGEAMDFHFACVCVAGSWVELCAEILAETEVKVATVVGFPLGATTSTAKKVEAAGLVELGADEIDMVAPIGRIIDHDWDYMGEDVRGVVEASDRRPVKVILETAVLNPTQIRLAAAVAMEAGAQFVKTSTGFHPAGGATEESVALLHATVGGKLGVKAAGGIKDRDFALRMVAAGATRIGTSKGVEIVSGAQLT